jgi:hypothetical protein
VASREAVADHCGMEHDHRQCAGCGDRVGVYEQLRAQYDDGLLVETSWLTLPAGRLPHRVWHRACAPAALAFAA